MKKVIIQGSPHEDGDTTQLVEKLLSNSNWEVIHLHEYQIGHFDYAYQNRSDDFLPLMKQILDGYDVLIFVTPVYWYAMSGLMKVFFDRITDLLTIEKELGRRLRGKSMAAVSCSIGNHMGDHFWLPFEHTAEYLGMKYLGNLHTIPGATTPEEIRSFIRQIDENAASQKSQAH